MKRKKTKSHTGVRLIYKIMLVLAVFIGSLIFFGSGIKETLFENELRTTEMKEASFPYISMEVKGREINLLHGYAANLDSSLIRECITPVIGDRTITVNIKDNGSDIKKLKYEISAVGGGEKESGDFTILEDDVEKQVSIALRENYESGDEFVLKLILINSSGKRIYYYTRLKLYDDARFDEKMAFIMNFHETLLDPNGKRAEELMDWLEASRDSDHSTLAKVNIKSRLNLVSYGGLEPEVVYEQIPTITEFYENYASVRIDYVLSVKTDIGTEYYHTEEDYRMGFTGDRIYLYNYERNMEEYFDINNFSTEKRRFKLGITGADSSSTYLSPNGKYMAFVYGGELISYNIEENIATKVFSFSGKERDFKRELYRSYDVKVLRILDDGSIDFYVSGYMNAGEYEGRVGIVLYNYAPGINALEERLYMPINCSYQVLNQDLSGFAFMDDKQIFYFSIYGNIYSYDIAASELKLLTAGVADKEMFFCKEENYIAWKSHDENETDEIINILHLDSGEQYIIKTPYKYIRLFGSINNNIVYGFERVSDSVRLLNGEIYRPCYKMLIADGKGNVLKTYEADGYYISGVEIGENIVTINRVVKDEKNGGYLEADSDTVLNKLEEKTSSVPVIKELTEKMLTEYYVLVPGENPINTKPKMQTSLNKVLNHETIARLPEPGVRDLCYYAYSFGRIVYSSNNAASVIAEADRQVGTVINREGRIIWERGIKMPRTEIVDINEVKADTGMSSVQATMKMITEYRGIDLNVSGFVEGNESIYEFLTDNVKPTVIDMTGCELDEVLYCVYRKHPVLAIKSNGEACVLVGYDPAEVIVYEPKKGRRIRYPVNDAENDFMKAGNVFITIY